MPEIKEETDIDFMKEQVRKLTGLLNDPQPGLVTWNWAFYKTIELIVNRFSRKD